MNKWIIDDCTDESISFTVQEKKEEIAVFLNKGGNITVRVGDELNEIPLSHAREIAKAINLVCKKLEG